ncbi:hypothetical protein Rxycam_01412 [Rubrobacter xylanophilus DSM 9941]|uniref:hypothetical protein n=1 Tax=Rubrobacter xylanophilus TaxID=49319 RepID=UPI001C64354A|nr:hypothetical protein [Rubrobacter xylanophilus]QYJ15588.1 hypothetical protein Rxycam_01412 [Rubrobacter xylanophilus DSM 9941]
MIYRRGTHETRREGPSAVFGTLPEGRDDGCFCAPLGSCRSGRLRLTGVAHGGVIRADPNVRGLYSASFPPPFPAVTVRGGAVDVRSSRTWTAGRTGVTLNATIPWDVEIRGGASRLFADLRDLRLGSFRLEGGARRVELTLPAPRGAVTVVVLGGASNLAIHRPAGVPARLCVEGGITHLRFDDRRIGAAGGRVDLQGGGYGRATDRYDIAVTGGANNLSVDEWQGRTGLGWSTPA